jgi:hypothetical protein
MWCGDDHANDSKRWQKESRGRSRECVRGKLKETVLKVPFSRPFAGSSQPVGRSSPKRPKGANKVEFEMHLNRMRRMIGGRSTGANRAEVKDEGGC